MLKLFLGGLIDSSDDVVVLRCSIDRCGPKTIGVFTSQVFFLLPET
jgi:hypothetical protein